MSNQYKRILNFVFVAGILVALYLWGSIYQNSEANPAVNGAQVSFLDVGEGDSALINLPNSTQILIDGGKQGTVLSQLAKRMPSHDRKIEYVIESHPDADHIGGLVDVFGSYEIGEVIKTNAKSTSQTFQNLENLIKQKNTPVKTPDQGETLSFGFGASGFVLSPDEKNIGSLTSNNSSIVLRFNFQKSCAMFTGDAEIEAQDQIRSKFSQDQLKCELMKVAHHGSAGAYEDGLTELINPQYGVISVGKNSYGHPVESVITSLNKLGIEVLRTDQKGIIDFVSKDIGWSLK